jgi:phenylacetate-coenzyme A ligase PaaK-like adenylate-forming protein
LRRSGGFGSAQIEIERKIKATLSVSASVELVRAGALPRYEMKGQLVKRVYEDKTAVAAEARQA